VVSILKVNGQTGNNEEERIFISSVNDVSQVYSNGTENPFEGSRA